MSSSPRQERRTVSRRLLDTTRVLVTGAVLVTILVLSVGPLRGVPGLLPSAIPQQGTRKTITPSTLPSAPSSSSTSIPTTTTTTPDATPKATPGPALRLRQQTVWLPPEGGVWHANLALDGVERSSNYELAVTVHQRVTNQAELARTFEGQNLWGQSRGGLMVAPLASVPLNSAGELTISIPTRGPNSPYIANSVLLYRPGIYPVSIEIRTIDEGRTVTRTVTHMLALDQLAPASRLGVSAVVGVEAPPILDNPSSGGRPEGAGELTALGSAIAALPPKTVTLAPSGETAEALAGSPGAPLVAWEQAAAKTTVITGPYVSTNPGSLGSQAAVELPIQLQVGQSAIGGTMRVQPDASLVWIDRPTDPRVLARLASGGVSKMLVSDKTLSALPRGNVGNRRPFSLRLPDREPVKGVAVDRDRTDLLERPSTEGIQAVYRLIADLAGEATLPENENSSKVSSQADNAVVLAPSRRTLLSPAIVTTLGNALTGSPVLRPMTVDQVFGLPAAQETERLRNGDMRAIGPMTRDLHEVPPTAPVLEDPVAKARTTWNITNQVMSITERPYPKLILAAQSDRLAPEVEIARLGALTADLEQELAKVQLQRSTNLSLTATNGAIPINVANESGRTVRVRIQLSSQKLEFPEGAVKTVDLERRSTTILVPVRARTSGNLPLTVVLTTSDGTTQLAISDEYRVRTSGMPGIGYVLIGGAMLVLALWWIRFVRRAARQRQAEDQ